MQSTIEPSAAQPAAVSEHAEFTVQRVRAIAAHCNKFRGAIPSKAFTQVATTLIPLALLVAAMFATVENHYWVTILLAIPGAGLLVRAFIIQHDCGHGSFLPTRPMNDAVGRIMSLLTLAPYGLWKREHAMHHATSGNLDKRGVGDIETLTVAEYQALSPFGKLRYRVYRNPAFLFVIGVPAYFIILQRLPWFHGLSADKAWKNVMLLNLALALVYGPLIYWQGVNVFWVFLPMVIMASATGGWLFFVQHQFEHTVWEKADHWDFQVAALLGSSYYVLPRIVNWFTGDIALHHIHHLNSLIPNYRLQECMNASSELASINRIGFLESLKCARLKLWDEQRRCMIGFRELRAA